MFAIVYNICKTAKCLRETRNLYNRVHEKGPRLAETLDKIKYQCFNFFEAKMP